LLLVKGHDMSSRGSIPDRVSEQVSWSGNLSGILSSEAEAYGVPAGLAAEFTATNQAVQAAWAVVSVPETRTRVSVATLHDALADMRTKGRLVISAVRAKASVTTDMLIAAGITVPKGHRTPAPVPQTAPILKMLKYEGRTATVELLQSANKRGRPARVVGAMIFQFTGSAPPFDNSMWKFVTITGETRLDIPFPPSETGNTVWVTACWVNSRKATGPSATPVSINLPAGGGLPTVAAEEPSVRLAA
jgi:hypothetical protein